MRLSVRLSPKASANRIDAVSSDGADSYLIRAKVTAAPEKGKANAALIALLAKSWGIRGSAIEIVQGETDRNKILVIDDDLAPQVRKWLDAQSAQPSLT